MASVTLCKVYPQANPYPVMGHDGVIGWRWFDECNQDSETLYPTELAACKALLAYIRWLDGPQDAWDRLVWPLKYTYWPKVRDFWNDTRGAC